MEIRFEKIGMDIQNIFLYINLVNGQKVVPYFGKDLKLWINTYTLLLKLVIYVLLNMLFINTPDVTLAKAT